MTEGPSPDQELRGELRDDLVRAMGRVPELAGRELTLTTLSGGITNRNFLVVGDRARTSAGSSAWPATTRTCSASAGRWSMPRPWRPPGSGSDPRSPRSSGPRATSSRGSSSARRSATRPSASRRPSGASPIRSDAIHDGPAIPGLFVPLRIAEAYRALAVARGVPIPPEYEVAASIGRRIELAWLAAPVELRPCHNDLLNANFIDDGTRIRIVDWEYAGMGDPFFDLGNFSINHELTPDQDAVLLAAYDGEVRPCRGWRASR